MDQEERMATGIDTSSIPVGGRARAAEEGTAVRPVRVTGARDAAVAALALSLAIAVTGAEAARRAADTARNRVAALPSRRQIGRAVGRALLLPVAVAVSLPATARRAASTAGDRVVPAATAALLSRLDVPQLAREYGQLDRVAADVDLDALARRLDLDEIASRVDLNALVDRVDVDRVLARTDVAGLARYIADEIDLPGLLRATTGSVSSEMVHGVRDQGAHADLVVARAIDKFLRREGRRAESEAPTAEPGPEPEAGTAPPQDDASTGTAP